MSTPTTIELDGLTKRHHLSDRRARHRSQKGPTMSADSATGMTDRIQDPIHRTSYAFRREGENLWVETWFADGAHLPEHFHPTLEEHWEMLAGTTKLKLDGH
jgi:quercetin dioxygenase-like cupin family protein